jgi:hypothetical protein
VRNSGLFEIIMGALQAEQLQKSNVILGEGHFGKIFFIMQLKWKI